MSLDLSGPVDAEGLGEALRRIRDAGEGAYSLQVSDGISERWFHFATGGLRIVRGGLRKAPRVGQILVLQGKLTHEQTEEIFDLCRASKKLFGASAVELGLLSWQEAEQALRTQVAHGLLDMFLWAGAEFRLFRGDDQQAEADRAGATAFSGDEREVIQRVIRQVESWKRSLGREIPGNDVYELTEYGRRESASSPYKSLLQLVDGSRTLIRAVEESNLPRVPAFEFLVTCYDDGLTRRLGPEYANKIARKERTERIEALELALPGAVDPVVVRMQIARAWEAEGAKGRSAGMWRDLGDHWIREGDSVHALDAFHHCVRLVPKDFLARDRIFRMHAEAQDEGAMLAEGVELAGLLADNGLNRRARAVLELLVPLRPEDWSLRRRYASVLIALDAGKEAHAQLVEMTALHDKLDGPKHEMERVLLERQALDPKDRKARKRMDVLKGRVQRRSGFQFVIVGTVFASALLLAAHWYERGARTGLQEGADEAQQLLAEGKFDDARERMARHMDAYPFSPTVADVRGLLAVMDELQTDPDRKVVEPKDTDTGRPPQQSESEKLRERADALLGTGDRQNAHGVLRKLWLEYPGSPDVAGISVPLRVTATPTGAKLFLDGAEVGRDRADLAYDPSAPSILRVERSGHAAREIRLDDVLDFEIQVELDRAVVWAFQATAPFESAPTAAGDLLYVAGRNRVVTALDPADGSIRWSTPLGFYKDVGTSPVLVGERLFAVTSGGEAICLDPKSGDVLWRKGLGVLVSRQPVAFGDDLLIVTGDDGSLRAIRSDGGALAWQHQAGTVGDSHPLQVTGRELVYADKGGALTFILGADGAKKRRTEAVGVFGAPVHALGRIWLCAGDRSVRSIAMDATLDARIAVPGLDARMPPEVVRGAIYLVGLDGRVVGWSHEGSKTLDVRPEQGRRPSAPPTWSEGELFIPCEDGTLQVLDAVNDGADLWSFDAGSRIVHKPIVTETMVILATEMGRVMAVAR